MRLYPITYLYHLEHNGTIWEGVERAVVAGRDMMDPRRWNLWYVMTRDPDGDPRIVCPAFQGHLSLREARAHGLRVRHHQDWATDNGQTPRCIARCQSFQTVRL